MTVRRDIMKVSTTKVMKLCKKFNVVGVYIYVETNRKKLKRFLCLVLKVIFFFEMRSGPLTSVSNRSWVCHFSSEETKWHQMWRPWWRRAHKS